MTVRPSDGWADRAQDERAIETLKKLRAEKSAALEAATGWRNFFRRWLLAAEINRLDEEISILGNLVNIL